MAKSPMSKRAREFFLSNNYFEEGAKIILHSRKNFPTDYACFAWGSNLFLLHLFDDHYKIPR